MWHYPVPYHSTLLLTSGLSLFRAPDTTWLRLVWWPLLHHVLLLFLRMNLLVTWLQGKVRCRPWYYGKPRLVLSTLLQNTYLCSFFQQSARFPILSAIALNHLSHTGPCSAHALNLIIGSEVGMPVGNWHCINGMLYSCYIFAMLTDVL